MKRLISATPVLLAGVFFWMFFASQSRANEAEEQAATAFRLADELRQSSDNLTRMARTYAVTDDPAFLDHFGRILDIRNGSAPRPERYHSVYWDLVIPSGQAARPGGEPQALADMLADANFTDQELGWLAASEEESNALAEFEEVAMEAGDEAMLFGRQYHAAKARIMAPLDSVLASVESRAQAARAAGAKRGKDADAGLRRALGRRGRCAAQEALSRALTRRTASCSASNPSNAHLMRTGNLLTP